MQEGLIDVWKTLERGGHPHELFIEHRMRRYARWLGRHYPVDYNDVLSLDALVGTPDEPTYG